MREFLHRDGCVVLTGDGDDDDQVIVEATITEFAPIRDSLRCTCGAVLQRWSYRPTTANRGEIVCNRCHQTHGHLNLGIRVHR
jgi:hypothetical protein